MLFISLKDINEYLDNYLWGDKKETLAQFAKI